MVEFLSCIYIYIYIIWELVSIIYISFRLDEKKKIIKHKIVKNNVIFNSY